MTAQLWVLYDSACPFCAWCRGWLEARDAHTELRFLCCRSAEARTRFGGLPLVDELIVVDDSGRWWSGPRAFVMCLWALEGGRELAWWLGSGALWWLARPVFQAIASERRFIGSLVGVSCAGPACEAPAPSMYR